MPNGKSSSSKAEVAIITHMEDVDRYRESPGEGATALQSTSHVSIASDDRKTPWTSGLRDDARFTRGMLNEQRWRHKCSCAVSPQQQGALNMQSLVNAASPRRTEGFQAEGRKRAVL
jgi:hypothetical protein